MNLGAGVLGTVLPEGNAFKGMVSSCQETGRYAAGKQMKCPWLSLKAVTLVGAKDLPGQRTGYMHV